MSGARQHDRVGEDGREKARLPRRPAPAPVGKDTTPDVAGDEAEPAHTPVLDLQRGVGNAGVRELVEQAGSDPGRPLDPAVRGSMEASFGRSFADVEVHRGPAVDASAQSMGAAAFAAGEAVYLHSLTPGPETPAGREILAEELAHVAQGVGARAATHTLPPEGAVEQEAHRAAHDAARGGAARTTSSPGDATGVGRFIDIALIGYGVKKLYDELTEEEVEAAKADPDQPSEATVAAIQGGVPPQLDAAVAKLGGEPSPATNLAVAESLFGVKDFLKGRLPPSNQGPVMSVLLSVSGAINTLEAAAEPGRVLGEVKEQVAAKKAELEGLVAGAKEPPVDPDGKQLEPDALTPDQASILSTGPVAWLGEAETMLGGQEPDADVVAGKLEGAAGAIRSVMAAPAVLPQLTKLALNCSLYADTVKATKLSLADSAKEATSQLEAAKLMIGDLGAPPPGEVPPTGGA